MSRIFPLSVEDRLQVSLARLIRLGAYARHIKLGAGQIRALHGTGYVSRFKGRGMEFDETRLYQPGDDIRSIDWKVTARTGKPHTRVYREERERPVFIAVDDRLSMQFATRGVFKSVQAKQLAALLAWAAERQSDRVGGQIFNDDACQEIKPAHGRGAVIKYLKRLVDEPLAPVADLDGALQRLQHHARPGSRIYLISDFRGIQASEQRLATLVRHCEMVLIQVYDPLEQALPANGRYRFTDGRQDVTIDTADRQRLLQYQQKFKQRQHYLQQISRRYKMTYLLCRSDDDPVQVLSR